MEVIKSAKELHNRILESKDQGKSVGFVPTMGALHAGHLQLIRIATKENDITVVSIFVNPTQFNNAEDLEKYPRVLDEDLALLREVSVDYVFAPSVDEIYPQEDTRKFEFNGLHTVMEGAFRPGHFNGVAQVVSRLLDIVVPTHAYFGKKDFQQLAIIRYMVASLKYDIDIVAVPIVRESTGLARSSRNVRLSNEGRNEAASIYLQLQNAKMMFEEGLSTQEIKDAVMSFFKENTSLDVEYFEIVDGDTLQPIINPKQSEYIVACIAVYCEGVRLIDNIEIKEKNK